MTAFDRLSPRQLAVFEQIATGHGVGHPQRTLDSLERLNLVTSANFNVGGRPPVIVKRYIVPLPVHMAWCEWCAEQPDEEEEVTK